jgi:hypothetical protein
MLEGSEALCWCTGDRFGNTPRKADFAWTMLARILSFAKDRGIIAVNPCERGRSALFWQSPRQDLVGG